MDYKVGDVFEHKKLGRVVQIVEILDHGGEQILVVDRRFGEELLMEFEDLEAYERYMNSVDESTTSDDSFWE